MPSEKLGSEFSTGRGMNSSSVRSVAVSGRWPEISRLLSVSAEIGGELTTTITRAANR